MPRYVDGFVLPVPKKNLAAYRRIASKAGRIWREHGALEYFECVGDDLKIAGGMTPFPRLAKTKAGETVVFAFIVYKSKAHRDRVTAKVMSDPRLHMDAASMPFDAKRMAYGGFRAIVDL
jgi:uncharacterized protein YbaA (DUF1428 family)